MKITALKLQNFRSHQLSELQLDRLNIIRGHNASGKSSLAMAIEYLLTGRCHVTDGAGRGADLLIQEGAQELRITGHLSDNSRIEASRNQVGGNLIYSGPKGQPQVGKAALAMISAQIAPIEVLSAVLNSGRFLEMDPKAQRALLAGALASEPVKIDAATMTLWDTIENAGKCETVHSSAEVDQLHKRFFELRTQVNRDIKGLGEIQPPEIPAEMPAAAEVSAKISGLIKARDTLVRSRSQKLEAYEAGRRNAERDQAQRELLLKRAQDAENRMLSNLEVEQIQKVIKDKPRVAKLDREILDWEGAIADAKRGLAEIERQPTCCPTCKRAYDAQSLAGREQELAAIRTRIKDAEGNLEASRAGRRKCSDPAQAEQRLADHRAAVADSARAEQDIKALQLQAGPSTPPDVTREDEELRQIDDRLAKGRAVEAKVLDLAGRKRQYETIRTKAETLKAQSEALDRLVEYFSDKGPLKGLLVGARLPAFRDRINEVLARFGFSCHFELDPYELWISYVMDHPRDATKELHSGGLQLRQLSESEQYRFAIAFQIALAEATGVRLVVIDRADMLIPEARRQLSQILLESELDQAFVLLTATEPLPAPPWPAGVKFFQFLNRYARTEVETGAEPRKELTYAPNE